MMENLPKVEITWKDTFDGPVGWVRLSCYEPQMVIPRTVGFLVHDVLEGYTTVCSSYFYDDDQDLIISNPVHIPVDMVTNLTHL